MVELLRDDIEPERRQTSWQTAKPPIANVSRPSRQDVPDLLSWVQCFGTYMYASMVAQNHPGVSALGIPDHDRWGPPIAGPWVAG